MDCPEETKEKIPDSLICALCRDLLYKPVVLGCGHAFCNWCVHYKSTMNSCVVNSCAVCQNTYRHFPNVCPTFELLLMKSYPNSYKKRGEQTIGEQESRFSSGLPQSDDSVATTAVSVADVCCGSCNAMLFQPAVLNCGHAFCAGCIVTREDEMLSCEVCRFPHPEDFPNVCLEFDNFLEEQFPTEYKQRRVDSLMKQKEMLSETPRTTSSSAGDQGSSRKNLMPRHDSDKVHFGVGCDACGMYPIIGDRYKCKDCCLYVGYDLCKDCYVWRSGFPGRFNQNHTMDHGFTKMDLPQWTVDLQQWTMDLQDAK